ncbi:hypothetical protein COT69_00635 [candidate division WWE3 bacterium CG09_land_8_20_14_0_10_39_24]|uniref:Uncharacterized protein n=2 Tax=Katanobacteria TaxID=422282 RepID=A0A2G9XCH0_UNCKA|nr:MAG: hypothetical protein BK003_00620 [bacterium CG09_39_24]PIP04688.1 MAG: hypothetical protein COX53_01140 [candidate division WWE3 bacterium CG23_combo_of_CG06-09_8_20_14_all_40_14]PIS13087.1 MAG: hypothetical protein COT69_00635 [candidate division WWE3 bacterium CG09_land_8_20_14_0_10_39_24]
MFRKNLWLIINLTLASLFLYYMAGVYVCDTVSLYNSNDIINPFPWEVYGEYGCALRYSLTTMFLSVVWGAITLLGLIIPVFTKNLKRNLKISLIFISILGLTYAFAYIREQYRANNLKTEQLSQKESELNRKMRATGKGIEENATGNYTVTNCTDTLQEKNNFKILIISCTAYVKAAGSYIIKGKVFPNSSAEDVYDNALMESNSLLWDSQTGGIVKIDMEYRHLAKGKSIPNGRYGYSLEFIPSGGLSNKLSPYIFKGVTTQSYSGYLFDSLPFKPADKF